MTDPVELTIGSPGGDHLTLRPTRRLHPGRTDYWDANWVNVEVEVRAGAFQGSFDADFRTDEFADFREQISSVHRSMKGEAVLECMERWIAVRIVPDPSGRLDAACEVRDDPTAGNELRFKNRFDQTCLPAMLTSLDRIVRAYAVIGRPEPPRG